MFRQALYAGLACAALAGPAAQASATLAFGNADDVAYVTGDVSEAALDQLVELSDLYHLTVLMTHVDGDTRHRVRVQIINSQGQTVLQTVAVGSLLLANLAPDTYTIEAEIGGQQRRVTTPVDPTGIDNRIELRW